MEEQKQQQHPGYMKKVHEDEYIWAEKYRPQDVEDIILPLKMKTKFANYIKNGEMPNIMLYSNSPGVGKSSLAHCVVKNDDFDTMQINASQDRGIDTYKGVVREFIQSVSIDGERKVVILEESDSMTGPAQAQLRALVEEFSTGSSFIFTCNYPEQIIEPIRNRCQQYDFDKIFHSKDTKKELAQQMYNRLRWILDKENISYEAKQLQPIITNCYPSMREMTILIQQFSTDGKLDVSEDQINANNLLKEILDLTKAKNFTMLRKKINDLDNTSALFSYVYKTLDETFTDECIPQVVIITAKYADMDSHARDGVINVAAFCVELMSTPSIIFK